jgi:hypothetical protein
MVHNHPVGERSASMNSWFRIVCGLGLLLAAIAVFNLRNNGDRNPASLQQMIAETDRLDAGWRLEDLDAGMQENRSHKYRQCRIVEPGDLPL